MLAAQIELDRSDTDGLARQLFLRIRQLIEQGRLKPGTRLPASRQLAADLAVGRNTVLFAYEQLGLEGYLEADGRRGTRVSEASRGFHGGHFGEGNEEAALSSARLSQSADRMMAVPRRDKPGSLTFLTGMPDVKDFPHDVWARLLRRAARQVALHEEMLGYAHYSGLPALKEAIIEHASVARGVVADADQVMILSSAQAAQDLVARLLLDEGDVALHEEPGYAGMTAALSAVGARCLPIRIDDDAPYLALAGDAGLSSSPRLIYSSPSHQFPTGRTMALEERLALLRYAQRKECFILEDDYDSEFHFSGAPISSLQGLDRRGVVIYMGTFSKALNPGLRVAYLIVPKRLVDPVKRCLRNVGAVPPVIVQWALSDFLREGYLRSHITRMTRVYKGRRDRLVLLLQERVGAWLRPALPDGGIQLPAYFHGKAMGLDDRALLDAMLTRGMEGAALSSLYWSGETSPKPGVLLGFAASDEGALAKGVDQLEQLLCQMAP
ncbi:GntR family transcriptional regulator / MocR family aminotransferase [Cohaesibacter marisflavi]|uniref:GntR family transcriptional regulator / MocR family aminotransferase n=1 Tax=Cohaesibacter marisflavi TaxID=655353 RepID=A0A1I5IY34_9HYPH|nr:PLP-dependent aminotransferase family protein [Cohaesibacter marisflavi]SFO65086.1 GntR family transcriptional regulator / MocR family aminotransferase [Cohaesibacter marisflavi]